MKVYIWESVEHGLVRSDQATKEQLLEMLHEAMRQNDDLSRLARTNNRVWESLVKTTP